METFRSEDEHDYEIWVTVFSRIVKKTKHPGMFHCTFFSPEKLALLPLLKDVKGAVSRNSAKLGNYKMPVKLRET